MIQSQAWLCLMFESMIAKLGFTINGPGVNVKKEKIMSGQHLAFLTVGVQGEALAMGQLKGN
jgi:hypothetical protein